MDTEYERNKDIESWVAHTEVQLNVLNGKNITKYQVLYVNIKKRTYSLYWSDLPQGGFVEFEAFREKAREVGDCIVYDAIARHVEVKSATVKQLRA